MKKKKKLSVAGIYMLQSIPDEKKKMFKYINHTYVSNTIIIASLRSI